MTGTGAADSSRKTRTNSAAADRARTASLVLIGVTASWGLTFPAIHEAVRDVDPIVFMALRMVFATLGLALVYRGRFFHGWRGRFGRGLVLGVTLYGSYALQASGLATTTASRSAFLTGLNVVLVPVFYVPVRKKWPGLIPILGVVLSAVGLYFFTRPSEGGLRTGDLLTLGTAVIYAFYVIFLESYTEKDDPEPYVMLQTVIVSACAILFLPFAKSTAIHWTRNLIIGLFITVPVAMITYVGLTRFQKGTTATRAAVIYSAEPVFALFFSMIWLGDRLDGTSLLGAALILSGVLLAAKN